MGDWNKSNLANGCFNTVECTIKMFNKDSNMTLTEWYMSDAHKILSQMPLRTNWKSGMTVDDGLVGNLEKTSNNRRQVWWNRLSKSYKEIIMQLPNFDSDIFRMCTGIDVTNS